MSEAAKRYALWAADLNSLYDKHPLAAVVYDRYDTLAEANEMLANVSDHETAAWIVDEGVTPHVIIQ
jgi:hypothetical protein